ncbi:MAG: sigma 54-interacting transcriptional regulator [Bilophila wadsworthia]
MGKPFIKVNCGAIPGRSWTARCSGTRKGGFTGRIALWGQI